MTLLWWCVWLCKNHDIALFVYCYHFYFFKVICFLFFQLMLPCTFASSSLSLWKNWMGICFGNMIKIFLLFYFIQSLHFFTNLDLYFLGCYLIRDFSTLEKQQGVYQIFMIGSVFLRTYFDRETQIDGSRF